ncbi:MAG TPA: ABC transporter permease [Bryobacteraceae bacterium]|nr:ABC transporter permease [Bryobacteraceae bacterium]
MRDLLKLFTHSFRVLRKNPGFTFSTLAVLSLGIGANTTIFSVVNAVLLRPLPFPDSHSVVTIFHVPPAAAFPGVKTFAVSPANYLDWRKQNDLFESMSVLGSRSLRIGGDAKPRLLLATSSDSGLFDVLGVKPELGRFFTQDECQPGRDGVIVLSHGFAENYFGSLGEALGKTLQLGDRAIRVIGIMPQRFQMKSWFPMSTEGWMPIAWTDKDRATRGIHNWLVVARLRPGVTVAQAQSAMDVISNRLAREYPEDDKGWGAVVTPLRDYLVGNVRTALLTLLGAVGFVLLIACANTANLVLARTIARRKEFAIRAALGASSAQVLRPVLVETTVLAIAGGALGLLVAKSGQALVLRALADQLPRATEVQLDGAVLAFTAAASILTGIAAGLLAGARLLRGDVNDSLKLGMGKGDAYSGGRRTRFALVVSEVALSLILLVGAGLMIRTLWALRGTDPGFQSAGILTISISIPQSWDKLRRDRLTDEFLSQVGALHGVRSAAAIDSLPLEGGAEQPIAVEGRPAEVLAMQRNVSVRAITPNYFRTMGIPLLAGRDIEPADGARRDRPAVAVISQTMARLFWPDENALGKRFRISFLPDVVRTVVGIAGDIKERGLDRLEPVSMLYLPVREQDPFPLTLVISGETPVTRLTPAITNLLVKFDSNLPVRKVRTMDAVVAATLSQHRFTMWLFAALAGLAFLLAAVGIYSVLAYSVRSRVQEIGVRIALGAARGDILRLVVSEGMRPALAGIALGACGALALVGVLSKLVYGVNPADPVTFCAVTLLLSIVAVLACVIPAYRATRIHPVIALRNE